MAGGIKSLDAGEYSLIKIFSSDFEFQIPDYQRPYSWGREQTLQLLDDLEGALDSETDEPYFLGSIVLVKSGKAPESQVIDGQQRLTTLTILIAAIRDLTANSQLARELADFVVEAGKITAGTKAKPRLTLRKRDAPFFQEHVQTTGSVEKLLGLADAQLATDAQHALRNNARALVERLKDWSEEKHERFAAMLGTRTFLVVVSTPDLHSAHRIFSVMNARGLDLTPADIFKSMVIGEIKGDDAGEYADKWEQEEQDLGRDGFAELFFHIRMIFAKERGRRELLLEFEQQVLSQYLPTKARDFVDAVLIPYSDAYERLTTQNYPNWGGWEHVNNWLARLMQIDNSDWRPPALWALKNHPNDPEFISNFLERLERVAASMLIRRVYATPRATKYAELLRQLEEGAGLEASAFALEPGEQAETLARLNGEIYLSKPVRRYVLLRLDEVLAKQPGVSYEHKMITVEHVLPQNPRSDSQWMMVFSEEDREYWLHRLANLVLLNRAKNSEAQRYEFAEKKQKYFTGPNGVAIFALTTQVLSEDEWTPAVLQSRQRALVDRLATEWKLSDSRTGQLIPRG